MKDLPKKLRGFYRKVIAHPEGAVVHYGDCSYYSARVCDCGLLRTLIPMEDASKWYDNYEKEITFHINRLDSLLNFEEA